MLGNIVDQILHAFLVAGECVVVVKAVDLHLTEVRPVVTEDPGPVNVRRKFLTV